MNTNAQRRRQAKFVRRVERRRRPGWLAKVASVEAHVALDPAVTLAAMQARLERSGMVER